MRVDLADKTAGRRPVMASREQSDQETADHARTMANTASRRKGPP